MMVAVALLLTGCATTEEIVKIAPDTYVLSRKEHSDYLGNGAKLKAGVIHDANAFAEKQGKVAVAVSSKETKLIPSVQSATIEYKFRVEDKG